MSAVIWALVMFAGVAMEIRADLNGRTGALRIGKPLASTVFLIVAAGLGALDSTYGQAVFAALVLSWFGDMFLIPKGAKHWFLAGLVSFLLGHVGYVVAFFVRGGDPTVFGVAFGVGLIPIAVVLRWLWPHVGASMKGPVVAYILVISSMLAAASMTVEAQGGALILAGAGLFYVSDLFVARHRFVAPGPINRMIGLPIYYAGQFLLALTVA